MLRLRDILELPVVRRALPDVVAGADGLDRELRWAHVIELAEPDDVLKGGELVLTTGIGAGTRERDQRRWIALACSPRERPRSPSSSARPGASGCPSRWSRRARPRACR